jgi:hypothetical protein
LNYPGTHPDPLTTAIFSRPERFWLRAARKCLAWYGPLRSLHRAVRSSERLISSARTAIAAARAMGKRRPLWAARQLQCASRWLIDAADLLHRATYAMQEANACLAHIETFDTFVPERLAEDALKMLDAAGDLNLATILLDAAVANALLLERSGYVADQRPAITVPPPGIILLFEDAPALRIRRRKSSPATIEDAARKCCRGRAPPFLATAV